MAGSVRTHGAWWVVVAWGALLGCRAPAATVERFVLLESQRSQQEEVQVREVRDAVQQLADELAAAPTTEDEATAALLVRVRDRHKGAQGLLRQLDGMRRSQAERLAALNSGKVSNGAFQRLEEEAVAHHAQFRAVTAQARRQMDDAQGLFQEFINHEDRTRPRPISFEEHEE